MHHARFQNVQSLINPLDEPIALIGTYLESDATQNVLANKSSRSLWIVAVVRMWMVAKSKVENGTYFLGQENEVINDEAASRHF